MKGIFQWFNNSSKMKRWIMLILVGVIFSSYGMANIIVSKEAITFFDAAKIILFFVIGFLCIVFGLIFINKRTMELFIEATDDRMEKDQKVNVNTLIFNKKIYNKGPKIVVIGGGSGLNTLVEGLKKYTSNITAVVTVSDYGEMFEKDNNKIKYMQLEDIKNGISALALSEDSKIGELLSYQFKDEQLKGVTFSDLYFYAMTDILKSEAEAVKASNEIFKIYGRVLPVTKDEMKICAELDNGYLIEEKSKIAETVYERLTKISRVYLNPVNIKPLPEVIEAIKDADGIIIGPGSLYTNIIPNLLVYGVAKAIKESKAIKLYSCNIMTEPGLTDDYSVADHINAIIDHCGEGVIDYCLYDTGEVVPEYVKKYNKDGACLVEQEIASVKDKKIKYIKENVSMIKDDFIRHNSIIIADTIIELICDDMKFKDRQNEPEFLMMDSKLKADKEINKKIKRQEKNKKQGLTKKKVQLKSKFAIKYSERINSIKNSDEMAEKRKEEEKVAKRKKAEKTKKAKKVKKAENIENLSKKIERLMNKNIEREAKANKEIIRPDDYERIRREKIRQFNEKGKEPIKK